MKNPTDVNAESNVIEVSFAKKVIPTSISHPESKWFNHEESAHDLLGEFDRLIESHDFCEDYVFHHQKQWDYRAQFSDAALDIAEKINQQLSRLKEDTRKIKYYLDEMDID
ncbi:MAG: hypothetical protein N4A33_11465 [Bacteriovoracaceae bacterium]|jgi:hypothetical protein|nr:hypothetical protein [Bacteriovoracaceae bacterium]